MDPWPLSEKVQLTPETSSYPSHTSSEGTAGSIGYTVCIHLAHQNCQVDKSDPDLTPGTVTTKSKFHVTLGHQTVRRPSGEALAFWVIKPVVKDMVKTCAIVIAKCCVKTRC